MNSNQEEIWKDIVGYEGLYRVSNLGRVKNTITHNFLKNYLHKSGYVRINIKKLQKNNNCRLHRLIARAFIPNPENKKTVNHIDGNKQNNSIENLEWLTQKENNKHARDTGLHKCIGNYKGIIQGFDKDGKLVVNFSGSKDMEKRGYFPTKVYNVVSGKGKTYKGLVFRRLETLG